jgi:hypothetical protein
MLIIWEPCLVQSLNAICRNCARVQTKLLFSSAMEQMCKKCRRSLKVFSFNQTARNVYIFLSFIESVN